MASFAPSGYADLAAVATQAAAEMQEEARIDAVESLGGAGTRSLLASSEEHDMDLSEVAQEILRAQPDLASNMGALKNIPGDILAAAAAAALPPQVLEPIPPRAPAAVAVAQGDDSDDSDDSDENSIHAAAEHGAEDHTAVEEAPSAPPRTENEAPPQTYAAPLDVLLDGSVTMTATGSVILLQRDQHSVVVQHSAASAAKHPVGTVASGGRSIDPNAPSQRILDQVAANILDEGSLVALCPLPGTIAPRIIGRVREVFGNVSEPMYLIQLSAEQCSERSSSPSEAAQANVFHAMAHMSELVAGETVYSIGEFSSLVDPSKCRAGKPTDASNRYDEEASDSEFSDDEAEAAARKAARSKRRNEQGVSDMQAAAAAASATGSTADANKRTRRAGKRRQQGVLSSAPSSTLGPPASEAAATIAAQQAQIQALQAHLASMQQAFGSGGAQHMQQQQVPASYQQYGAAQYGAPPRAFPVPAPQGTPATARVPSSAAQQFMAAAARAAANVAKSNSL